MTLQQLHYALALKKHGNFKRAAESLGITQPGLSLQIQKLEEFIGVILFDRTSSPITPTSDGARFLMRAEDVVVSAQNLTHFSTELNEGFKGKLVIGAIPTLAPFLVPLFVEDLQTDFPEFQLDFHEMTTDHVIKGVRSGELDAGLISTPLKAHGIETIPLFYEQFYFYAFNQLNVNSEVLLKDMDYRKLWLLNEGNCFRDQINNFCDLKEIRKDKDFIYRSNSIDALIRMVDTKGGMTILPELTTLSLNEDQESKLILIEKKAREIGIILRPNSDKRRFIAKLEEYIQRNIPNRMLSSEGLEIVDPEIKGH